MDLRELGISAVPYSPIAHWFLMDTISYYPNFLQQSVLFSYLLRSFQLLTPESLCLFLVKASTIFGRKSGEEQASLSELSKTHEPSLLS
jgi:hypothetical protein